MKNLTKKNEKELMRELEALDQQKKEFKKVTDRIDQIKKYFKNAYKGESVKSGDLYLMMTSKTSRPWRSDDLIAFLGDRVNEYRDEKVTINASFKSEAKKKAA